MPNITWALDKTCDNCGAEVHYESQLGEKFKLSEADKLKQLYAQAQAWVSAHPKGDIEPYSDELDDFILPPIPYLGRTTFRVIDTPMFLYVKCPVCNERIYVC